jgi:uncharacterized membrane protein (DUF485 family)
LEAVSLNSIEKKELIQSSAFQQLIREKRRFIISATLFFMIFYFMLPLSISVFPDVMNKSFFHQFTWAWAFAFFQFFMVWGVGLVYFYKAKRFDKTVEEIKHLRNKP